MGLGEEHAAYQSGHAYHPSLPPDPTAARMETLQPFHDFFLLTGGVSATLLGLVFVAASIAATIPKEKLGPDAARALWVMPIVYSFVRVIVVSAVGVIPGQTWRSFGLVLSALAVLDLSRSVWTTLGMTAFHRSQERLDLRDWAWYVIFPAGATLLIAVTGFSLVMEWPWPVQLLAAGMIGHVVVGVHNAWELADWLITRT